MRTSFAGWLRRKWLLVGLALTVPLTLLAVMPRDADLFGPFAQNITVSEKPRNVHNNRVSGLWVSDHYELEGVDGEEVFDEVTRRRPDDTIRFWREDGRHFTSGGGSTETHIVINCHGQGLASCVVSVVRSPTLVDRILSFLRGLSG